MSHRHPHRLIAFSRRYLPGLVVSGIFIMAVLLLFHSRARLEFDGDEGLNLMRALLIDHGYVLYEDIWSDQPPIYPHILAAVFQVIGYKVGGARMVSLLFSGLMMWSVFQFLRTVAGMKSALVGALLLFLLPAYLRLSISVMVGLPAISFAALSLVCLASWHQNRRTIWLALSALLLSVSILTKLFTAILAPVFAAGILIQSFIDRNARASSRAEWMKPVLIWGFWFIAPSALIALTLIKPEHFPLLFEGHLAAADAGAFQGAEYTLSFQLREAQPVLFLGILGAIQAVRDRKRLLLYPASWLLFGMVFLLYLHPIWYHHQLLVTIPAVPLASYTVVKTVNWLSERMRAAFEPQTSRAVQAAAAFGVLSLFFMVRPPGALDVLQLPPTFATTGLEVGNLKEKMIDTVIEYGPDSKWILTDKPMIAFRARIPVPPEIAVFSRKRLETGAISETLLIDIVREYQPEQVLLGRFDFPNLEASLQDAYSLEMHKADDFSLYIRRDLLENR